MKFNCSVIRLPKKGLQVIIIYCLLLISFNIFGQEKDEYSIFNYSVDKGLSQSTVYSIRQDSRGFIWIGTRGGGLNRFDGYEFRVFRSNYHDQNSISGNEVISIYEDKRGYLWIGNRASGLDRFDKNTEQFIHYKLSSAMEGSLSINCFLEDRDKKLWMGNDTGLFYYDEKNDSFVKVYKSENCPVSSIVENKEGDLILGSRTGILQYNKKRGLIERKVGLSFHGFEKGRQWNPPLLLDSKGNLWFGGLQGLFLVKSLEKGEMVKNPFNIPILENANIRSIIEDRNGLIWVGFDAGLVRVDPLTGSYILFRHNDNNPESIGHSSVYSLLEDDKGNIWIGTWGGGVSMLSYLPRKFRHYVHIPFSNSLSNNLVSSFAETSEGIWIGTEGGGVNFFDFATRQFRSYRKEDHVGLQSNNVKCILNDSENNVWIGTWGNGLYRFNKPSGRFEKIMGDLNVFSLTEDKSQYLWIGSLNGLYKLDKKTGKYSYYSPENGSGFTDYFITALFCDDRGNIWAGTKSGGLYQYNPLKDNFNSFLHHDGDSASLIDNYVISINQDSARNLWIGTNKGLCRFDFSRSLFEDHSGKVNLPDNVINGIVPDNSGNLWLSTNRGISCYYTKTLKVRNFDIRDGLQSNEFTRGAYLKTRDGEIYFGGINGYNSFNPANIRYNQIPPKIVITEFKLFNQPVLSGGKDGVLTRHISETEQIKLNYRQSFFEIEFVALNYLHPTQNKYRYKLEGYNNDWVDNGTLRKASFMNLKEGEYIFRVTGSNNDGVWNTEGASLKIKVLPPPWKTGLAYFIYIAVILFSLFLLQRFMSFRIEQKNLVRMERLEKERNEQLNKLKLQFFTNITHEFRTPLTLINGPVDLLLQENLSKEQKSFYYRIIKNNIHRLKRLVDQILEFRKIENEKLMLKVRKGNLHTFLFGLYENFVDLASRKNVDFRFESDIDEKSEHWFSHDFIDKIVFNLLSNAFKFTGNGGSIQLKATVGDGLATISVKDTGKGISDEKLPFIFERFHNHNNPPEISGSGIGLYLSRRLAETHKGTIDLISEVEKGSEFIVKIPVSRDNYTENEIESDEYLQVAHDKMPEEIEFENFLEPEKDDHFDDRHSLLLVDDNRELVSCLGSFLSRKYHVRVAFNGKEALSIARDKFPGIIISDLLMPEMDGLELCRKIKTDILINHIPVILLTAKAGTENQIAGLNSGADAYIEKPFDFVYLETVIENLLIQRDALRKRFALEMIDYNLVEGRSQGDKFIAKAEEIINKSLGSPEFSIDELGQELNMSRSQLFRKFRALLGMSPSDFIRISRLKKSAILLLRDELGVNQVAYEVGFSNPSHFITAFKKLYGTTPKQYLASKKGIIL